MISLALNALLFSFSIFHVTGLQFNSQNGQFKILQVADMHYANGQSTPCKDVLSSEVATCSDLNTTAFLNRMIQAEKPDLIVFTGDNIMGSDVNNSAISLDMAFAPAISAKLPWTAVLGNHDQQGTLNRSEVMNYIVKLKYTLSQVNPENTKIDGYGNYNLQILGPFRSEIQNKSALNLYLVDSGDYGYPANSSTRSYGWVKESQQEWMKKKSTQLQEEYISAPNPQQSPAPALVFYHIAVPEVSSMNAPEIVGQRQESTGNASINSGFFNTMVETGDVKAAFTGHDHLNDFCGELKGIHLCNAGGFGYHAYGEAGWPRRARIVMASLGRDSKNKSWAGVSNITTWKRLDDANLSNIDFQVLWSS